MKIEAQILSGILHCDDFVPYSKIYKLAEKRSESLVIGLFLYEFEVTT